ncbi:hypothetical protein [Bartonella elizabethae]|uniref:Uncharacterized protein n=1 Tax=Bartonella elizabethae F9251 = ATCC 49927 TaxID=1094555 RepID=J1KCN1_BAREL|nr:hypothetical protein [Bartonella elizabethae]EJF95597.1 hypothetical protein MEE_00834 [Bartonella elizabethae F9251 = ATCC 49927]VEJ41430.1 Uncharacterised protein [Bartonella elizabethae]
MADHLPPPLQGRSLHTQQVSFLRLNFSYKDKENALRIGILPRGALITSIKVFVKTAFSDTKVKIGSTAGGKEFGEAEIKQQAVKEVKPTNQKEFVPYDEELTLYAKMDKTVQAGEASVVVEFVTNC